MRIIVANDPRAYREVIAAAFSGARPEIELITLEAHELDEAIVRLQPDFVVCSQVSEILETRSAAVLGERIDAIATSRWIKLGNRLGFGPKP